jgi:RAT1-interacting protein
MKRAASDLDADEGPVSSKRLRTGSGPIPTPNRSAGDKRDDTPKREVEATGEPLPKLELAYPTKRPPSGNSEPPVPFQQPTPLTTFSYDSKRELHFDDSALRYYVDPPHGADLRTRLREMGQKARGKGRLDGLLKAWLKVRKGFRDGSMNGGVIAWRGVMTRYVKARDQPSSRLLLPDHVNWVIFMD